MSMGLLTALQFLKTLFAYFFVTIVIPSFVLSGKIAHYRFAKRIMIYFMTGNFYAINLVFALELLHISNFFTIWMGLAVVPILVRGIIYKFPLLEKLRSFRHSSRKVISGTLGFRNVVTGLWDSIRPRLVRWIKSMVDILFKNLLDFVLISVLVGLIFYVYGTNMVTRFGLAASDIPVHLYWTNSLIDNDLFVAGIYPEGMHCMIYLLGTAFRIDIYVIFRVFGLVQTTAVHLMPLLFLKLCCKSRFAPYPGVFLYAAGNYIITTHLFRYLSALPQEFSMIFIFPSAYFAMSFFVEKRREIAENAKAKDSLWALAGLVMSFSLSVATHFYGAIIAVLFCLGVAAGFARWLIKPAFLKPIVIAGALSLFVAVLPMAIAFIGGTPLQGSLGWATNIIKGSVNSGQTQSTPSPSVNSSSQQELPSGAAVEANGSNQAENDAIAQESIRQPRRPVIMDKISKIRQLPSALWLYTGRRLGGYILRNDPGWYNPALRYMIIFLVISGAIFMLFRATRLYGAMLMSAGVFMVFMSIMFNATSIGLPALLGADRTSMFYSYSLTVVLGLTIDVCAYLAVGMFRVKWPMSVLTFALTLFVGIYVFQHDAIRKPIRYSIFETNEAITCLTNIIATEDDYTWTIFSANDETHMVNGHGYHYEPITFLNEIKRLREKPVTVPTETVYFYIEKMPINYAAGYSDMGLEVSEEGASQPVPSGKGLTVYIGKNRWIVMSHMYYWAKEFQRLYPNEMTVYMETDNFVCYKLEQNTYRLYDLSIDYGYNNPGRVVAS